jgi:RNA polymerase sigma-B factor
MTSDLDNDKKIEELFISYFKSKNLTSRNKLVEHYLYLIDFLVKRYLNKGVDYDDLYQIGSMALVYAVERFDPTKGFEFSSFAAPTIIGEIKRYFRDKGWIMKIPRRMKDIVVLLPSAREDLHMRLQRPPTIQELSEEMGYSEEEILEAMESGQSYNLFSLNQAFDNVQEGEETSPIEQYTGIEEEGYEDFETADIIAKVMKGLSEKEKRVFTRRLIQGKTQQETAEELNLSQMSISRMERDIKSRFRTEYYR